MKADLNWIRDVECENRRKFSLESVEGGVDTNIASSPYLLFGVRSLRVEPFDKKKLGVVSRPSPS